VSSAGEGEVVSKKVARRSLSMYVLSDFQFVCMFQFVSRPRPPRGFGRAQL